MLTLTRDLQFAARLLWKRPGFAAVIIATLAVGIGASTAIFSIVDAVLLRPLPFHDPQQLVRIVDNVPGNGLKDIGMSVPELEDLRDRSGIFQDVSATWPVDANVTGGDKPERIELLAVSPNYFTMLGAHAQLGRVFGPQDEAKGFSESVVISDGLWQRLFGRDPNVLGKKVRADNDVYYIVGVMPADFRHPGRTISTDVEIWGTAGFSAAPFPNPPPRAANFLPGAIGRLKPGLTLQQAQAQMDAFTDGLKKAFPAEHRAAAKWFVQLEPLQESLVGNVRTLLLVLLGAVALMLLTGCVNIANLLLARASDRQREVAIRQALGASRFRLIRQFLTESLLLALIGGLAGIAVASGTMKLLLRAAPERIPRLHEVALDARVLLFALGVSLLTGILFGLLPALEASSGLARVMNARSGRSVRQNRVSGVLVISEVAICMVLMIGAGLLSRSFWKLTQLDPGFNPRNVLTGRIWLPTPNDPKADPYANPQARIVFMEEVLRRVKSIPGVTHAAMTSSLPLAGTGNGAIPGPVTAEGMTIAADTSLATVVSVSPEYFRVMETPLMEGRELAESDLRSGDPVAVVDRTTARKYWANQSALGKRIKLGRITAQTPWMTVVGVVGDIKHNGLDVDGVPHIYQPIYQRTAKALGLLVRTSGDSRFTSAGSLGESMIHEVQAVDPTLPVFGVQTMDDIVSTSLAQRRFSANLVLALAGFSLLLAVIGVYGVLACSVGQRTKEIGIRMALGAKHVEVIRMILLQGLRLIGAGVVAGVIGALGFGRFLTQLLYGVSPSDPLILILVPMVLVIAAIAASYIPAQRATRIDPIQALRTE